MNVSAEVDPTKIVSDFVEHRYQEFLSSALTAAKSVTDAIKANWKATCRDYLKNLLKKHSTSRSFLIREEPLYLYDFYIPLGVKRSRGKREFNLPEIHQILEQFHRVSSATGAIWIS